MRERHCRLMGCLIVLIPLVLFCGCRGGDDQGVLFQDDFENARSGWGADEQEEYDRGYRNGVYFIELHEPNWFAWAHPGKKYDDVSIEVDARVRSGGQDGHYGLLCRRVDDDNFYYFSISADGYYAIFHVDDGDAEVLTADGRGMVAAPGLKTGRQPNRVLAVCKGDELSLYANGELLATVYDDTLIQGDVGLGAGSGVEGRIDVRFDDLVVTEP